MIDRPRPKVFDTNYNKMGESKKHENRLANRLGGKRLPRSGGMRWSKYDSKTDGGDLATPDFLFEHKRTVKASMSLKREWLEKVKEGAIRKMKDPGVIITFQDDVKHNEDWVMVPIEVFEKLKRAADYEGDE